MATQLLCDISVTVEFLPDESFSRPLRAGSVKSVEYEDCHGDQIFFRFGRKTRTVRDRDPLADLFSAVDGIDSIKHFCKRWGALMLCRKHGLPMYHDVGCVEVFIEGPKSDGAIVAKGSKVYAHIDSITSIRRFAEALLALLQIGTEVKGKAAFDEQLWRHANLVIGLPEEQLLSVFRLYPRPGRVTQVSMFSFAIARLVEMCQLHPRLEFAEDRSVWQLSYDVALHNVKSNLCAILAMNLLSRLSLGKSPAFCTICGTLYRSEYQPSHTRANICPDCKANQESMREAVNLRKRRSRARRAELPKLTVTLGTVERRINGQLMLQEPLEVHLTDWQVKQLSRLLGRNIDQHGLGVGVLHGTNE